MRRLVAELCSLQSTFRIKKDVDEQYVTFTPITQQQVTIYTLKKLGGQIKEVKWRFGEMLLMIDAIGDLCDTRLSAPVITSMMTLRNKSRE